jgi:XTP/dITP diphosphohydrolase
MQITLGTNNRKKGIELAALLKPHGFEVRTLADLPTRYDVVEDGNTFAENATKKAVELSTKLNCWVIGEDSGISVDALNGEPGIYSARFANGEGDEANNDLLLKRLSSIPTEKRTAHYTCHATLCDPMGKVRAESEGICRGIIRQERTGKGGFGYDPLFEVVEYHKTFGELSLALKQAISHRSRALRMLIEQMLLINW